MARKMTDKHKMMAYVLNEEYGYTMVGIAQLMSVSQSTISSAIKDIRYEKQIYDLTEKLNDAKSELNRLGYDQPDLVPFFEG